MDHYRSSPPRSTKLAPVGHYTALRSTLRTEAARGYHPESNIPWTKILAQVETEAELQFKNMTLEELELIKKNVDKIDVISDINDVEVLEFLTSVKEKYSFGYSRQGEYDAHPLSWEAAF